MPSIVLMKLSEENLYLLNAFTHLYKAAIYAALPPSSPGNDLFKRGYMMKLLLYFRVRETFKASGA